MKLRKVYFDVELNLVHLMHWKYSRANAKFVVALQITLIASIKYGVHLGGCQSKETAIIKSIQGLRKLDPDWMILKHHSFKIQLY